MFSCWQHRNYTDIQRYSTGACAWPPSTWFAPASANSRTLCIQVNKTVTFELCLWPSFGHGRFPCLPNPKNAILSHVTPSFVKYDARIHRYQRNKVNWSLRSDLPEHHLFWYNHFWGEVFVNSTKKLSLLLQILHKTALNAYHEVSCLKHYS